MLLTFRVVLGFWILDIYLTWNASGSGRGRGRGSDAGGRSHDCVSASIFCCEVR